MALAACRWLALATAAPPYASQHAVVPTSDCLQSGSSIIGRGAGSFCIDVDTPVETGAKLVVDATVPRALADLQIGGTTLLRAARNASARPIILEVAPSEQGCSACDGCACIGCGSQCACACSMCAADATSCALTAGVLRPGRWWVRVDAPGEFRLSATLVLAVELPSGAMSARMLVPASAPAPQSALPGGRASVDFFVVRTAAHQSVKLEVEPGRVGPGAAWVDVYVRQGAYPTSTVHDGVLSTSPELPRPLAFTLQSERLVNEFVYVMVVARGQAWVSYAISADAGPSAWFWLAIGLATVVVLCVVLQRTGFPKGMAPSRAPGEGQTLLPGAARAA